MAHDDTRPLAEVNRPRDAERTRVEIIAAARAEFAAKGFSGARMDAIAGRTRTTKPAIYYHFGSKQALYLAVLEAAYTGMREAEQALHLAGMPAQVAVRHLVEASFDYHASHPDWVRLVIIENIHEARHITGSATIAERNANVIGVLRALLDQGEREGVFRAGLDALEVHLIICSLCFYRMSNRHTWGAIFGRDLQAAEHVQAHRRMAVEAVLRYLTSGAVLEGATHARDH